MIRTALSFCTLLTVLGMTAVAQAHDEPKITEAVAVLAPKTGGDKVAGTILFKQEKNYVLVVGEVTGLKPGNHGFHIHEFGDLRSSDGNSAGGHYNPDGHPHGGPESKEHHAGDLGNIKADDAGVAIVSVKAMGLSLHHVLGRSIVVHANPDDFRTQKPPGNAGPRIAVGVIGLAEMKK